MSASSTLSLRTKRDVSCVAKDFAVSFYKSQAWKNTRDAYAKKKHHLCEMCMEHGVYSAGVIVHHKTELTPANICDENITLGEDNLMLLCRECHAKVHSKQQRRYKVDIDGSIVALD